jgi:uncharacterized membrane protein
VLGALLAVLSAATFAFNNASVRRGVLTGTVVQAMAITVPLGVPLFFLAVLVSGNLAAVAGFSPKALVALALAGSLHFVWGRYCNYRATRAIGANLVAPIQQVHLIVSLTLAIWLLGEELTALRIVGIALVLLGPSLIVRARKTKNAERAVSEQKITAIDAEKPAGFEPKYAEGYLYALLSAIGYGLSPILVRLGLEGKGIGVSLAGGLVDYIAASAVMALVLLWPGLWRNARAVDRESAKWFTLSGVLVFLSQMFLYMAMSIAPVTVVSPVTRLSLIAATVVSLAGAVALSLSADVVQSLLPLPDALVSILHWHWP